MQLLNISKTKKRFLTALITSGLAVLVNYMISLLLTSYITDKMGADAYGFVSLARTISGYATILTTCLNAYAARYISVEYHNGNIKKANIYYSTLFYSNIILSVVTLFIFSILLVNLQRVFIIPSTLLLQVKLLFLFDIINFMILSIGVCFSVYGHIKNRLDYVNLIKFISYLGEAILLIVLFIFWGDNLYYVGLALSISSCIAVILNKIISLKTTPELKIKGNLFSLKAVKELVFSGMWNSFNQLGNMLNSGLDLIVTNRLLSALVMGEVAVVKTFSTIFATLFSTIATPFQPMLLKAYAEGNVNGVVTHLKRSIRVCSYFSNMLFAGIIAFGVSYYSLWTPGQDIQLLYQLTIITALGHLIEGTAYPIFYTYTLTLKNRIPCVLTIVSGLINILGMYCGIRFFHLGVYCVVGTTTILAWMMHFVFTPIYSAHCLKIKWTTFYPTIVRALISGVLCSLIFVMISNIYMPKSWLGLLLIAIFCALIGLPIHFCVCIDDISELKRVISLIISKAKSIIKKQ